MIAVVTRRDEVARYLTELGREPSERQIDRIARELDSRCNRAGGCLSVGGSSVKDWIRLWFSDREPPGKQLDDIEHVTAVLHFWAWDEEAYGPPPTEWCGTNVDTMRSPTYRLRDSSPIDRVAWKVAGKGR